MSFVEGDVLRSAAAVASADVIYCSNVCFPEAVNAELGAFLTDFAKPGSILYLLRELPGFAFPGDHCDLLDRATLVEKIPVKMTWKTAPSDVQVYEFHGDPIWAEALPKHSALDEAFGYWSVDGALPHAALAAALEHAP